MGLSELQQVNAIIGLSKKVAGWPSTLADHRYSLDRIELKLKIPDATKPGISIVVNPDLLFVSDERNYSLVVELKSGSYHDHDLKQIENLVAVTPVQLIRDGRVTLQHASSVLTHRISVMLVVNHDNLGGFLSAIKAAANKSCLVSLSTTIIQTQHGTLSDNQLDSVFRSGIAIDKSYLPTGW